MTKATPAKVSSKSLRSRHAPSDTRSGADSALSTPGVTFHRKMTAAKRALFARSPLARLVRGQKPLKRSLEVSDVGSTAHSAADPTSSSHSVGPYGSKSDDADQQPGRTPLSKKSKVASQNNLGRAHRRRNLPPVPQPDKSSKDGLDHPQKPGAPQTKGEKNHPLNSTSEEHVKVENTVSSQRGVVYIGHMPHGFYEKQMTKFFSQFGRVTRVKVSRSRKTARSRGYAFVEFANPDVAQIAAEAMDGYMMLGRSLVAKFLTPEELHPSALESAGRLFRKIPWASIERNKNLQTARDPKKLNCRAKRAAKAFQHTLDHLVSIGIKYKFPQIPALPMADAAS